MSFVGSLIPQLQLAKESPNAPDEFPHQVNQLLVKRQTVLAKLFNPAGADVAVVESHEFRKVA